MYSCSKCSEQQAVTSLVRTPLECCAPAWSVLMTPRVWVVLNKSRSKQHIGLAQDGSPPSWVGMSPVRSLCLSCSGPPSPSRGTPPWAAVAHHPPPPPPRGTPPWAAVAHHPFQGHSSLSCCQTYSTAHPLDCTNLDHHFNCTDWTSRHHCWALRCAHSRVNSCRHSLSVTAP